MKIAGLFEGGDSAMSFVLIRDERDSVLIVNITHIMRINLGLSLDDPVRVTMLDKTQFTTKGEDARFLIQKLEMSGRAIPEWLSEPKEKEAPEQKPSSRRK
jgi:hypothetical protein